MQILSLQLDNAKSYGRANIDFAEGVNAIVGHNGAGKSTILEAIGFVLFDALGYRHDEFVREGASAAEIRVEFRSNLDERVYQVIRRCGGSTQYRVFDPELQLKVCEGKADVLRFLRQHMGVEPGFDLPALFRDAVGVPQGACTAIFLEAANQRKPTFDRLLQVEEYSRAADRLRDSKNVLRDRRQALEVKLAGLSARLEQLTPLMETVAQRTLQMAQIRTTQAETEAQLVTVDAHLSALNQIQQQLNSLRDRQTKARVMAENQAAQLAAVEDALSQAQMARTTVALHQPSHDLYVAAQSRQQELDAQARERQALERRHSALKTALAQAEAETAAAERELLTIAQAEAEVASLAQPLAEQTRLEAELALAQQQQARLADARTQATREAQQVTRVQNRLADLTAQLSQMSGLEARSQAIDTSLSSLRQLIDQNKEQQIACRNAAEGIKKQQETLTAATTALCPICEQPLSEAHRQTLVQRNEQRLTELRGDYKRYSDQVRADEATLKGHENERQQLQQQMLRLPRADEREQAAQEALQAQERLAATQALVEQLSQAPQAVLTLQAALADLNNPRQRHAVAAATAGRRAEVEARANQLATQTAADRTQLADYDAALARFAGLDAALDQVRTDLRTHEAAYQAVLEHRQLAETVEQRAEEVQRTRLLWEASQGELTQVEVEVNALAAQFDSDAYQRLVVEEKQLRSTLGGLKSELHWLEQQQQKDEQEVAALCAQQEEWRRLEAQKSSLVEQEEVLEGLRGLLKQAGPQVTRALIQQVSISANQIFCEMMQDYTRRLAWNEDYSITLEVEGRERQFVQLSGGEQMCAALAVRLALLREMTNIDIAFFDEPTTNLDETRRESLVRQILDIKGFRQLFVISHDDTFEQATQNLIRIRRVNGVSVVAGHED
jgi:DNA repair protein SbcC/Rad50